MPVSVLVCRVNLWIVAGVFAHVIALPVMLSFSASSCLTVPVIQQGVMPDGVNFATQYRYDHAAEPHVVSVPHTAGGYDVLPTGKQVRVPSFACSALRTSVPILEGFILPVSRGD